MPNTTDTPLTVEKAEAVIEALLFTMGEPISTDALCMVTGLDRNGVREAVKNLMTRLHFEGRGVRVIELDGSYQMCTAPEMYDYVIQLTHQPKKPTLTGVMLETLAIVAYKQPVTRTEIEQIRGVSCSHAINKLLECGLIMEAGRLNAPGRPILFATTEDFLRTFGVSSVEELPPVSPEQMETLKEEAEVETGIQVEV